MAGTVLYERDGHVATITYNRPEALNAVNAAPWSCCCSAVLHLFADSGAGVASSGSE